MAWQEGLQPMVNTNIAPYNWFVDSIWALSPLTIRGQVSLLTTIWR